MKTLLYALSLVATSMVAGPAVARSTIDVGGDSGGGDELAPVLQCVPYARRVSGIQIYGDAHTWWGQAKGRYARGKSPRPGAVMAIRPHGNSELGHVAAVSRIIDSRTVLLKHANWSEPGLIEDDVQAVDVSPNNDWSKVRIWYGPTRSLGANQWPLYGFIYNEREGKSRGMRLHNRPGRSERGSDPIGDLIEQLNS